MNVLMTLSQLEVTGAEVYAVTIANMLIDRGHQVYIMSDTLTKPTKAEFIPIPFNKRCYFNRVHQIFVIARFIREHRIHVVHAHSRAAGWVSYFATRLCRIPMITTVHGRRHVHLSSILVKALGDKVIAICENVKEQLVRELKAKADRIEILRNPIQVSNQSARLKNIVQAGTIAVIGRMSSRKGDVLRSVIKTLVEEFPNRKIVAIGSHSETLKVSRSNDNLEVIGSFKDAKEWISHSTVVVASGRIAAEALICKVPTVAVGEDGTEGLINEENIEAALKSNFGDIGEKEYHSTPKLVEGVNAAMCGAFVTDQVASQVRDQFDPEKVLDRIVDIYRSQYVMRCRREIPILTYHRVVQNRSEAGKHGIYVTADQFRKQLAYLKKKGYETITFNGLSLGEALQGNLKKVMLTFDDGYEDNYAVMFPILKEFGFTATVFLVTDLDSNSWDNQQDGEPFVRLLSKSQIREMMKEGIEFGSHSRTHRDLKKLSENEMKDEITGSREKLEEELSAKVTAFCYPYGSLNEQVKHGVRKAGYKFGIATDSGPIPINDDLFEVRRIAVFPNTTLTRFTRKVGGDYTFKQVDRYRRKMGKEKERG